MFQEELFPKDFSDDLKKQLFWENGPLCRLCSRRVLKQYSISPLYLSIGRTDARVHHVIPASVGGYGIRSNALVCCVKCHKGIHEFLSMFDLKVNEYVLYTVFYVWLFLPDSEEIESIRRRFKYDHYAPNLKSLARKFKQQLKRRSALTRMLVSYYVHSGRCKKGAYAYIFISKSYSVEKIKYQLTSNKESVVDIRDELFFHFRDFHKLRAV